jgi:hypothetical protein
MIDKKEQEFLDEEHKLHLNKMIFIRLIGIIILSSIFLMSFIFK